MLCITWSGTLALGAEIYASENQEKLVLSHLQGETLSELWTSSDPAMAKGTVVLRSLDFGFTRPSQSELGRSVPANQDHKELLRERLGQVDERRRSVAAGCLPVLVRSSKGKIQVEKVSQNWPDCLRALR
jgi:hypothetical protein